MPQYGSNWLFFKDDENRCWLQKTGKRDKTTENKKGYSLVPKNSWNFERRIPKTRSKDRHEKYEYNYEFLPVKKNEIYYDSALKFELISIVKERLISPLN